MPDINGMPPSPLPQPTQHRRLSSHQMPPPTGLASPALNILPSNQNAVSSNGPTPTATAPPPSNSQLPLPTQSSVVATSEDNTASGSGSGPLRHPRPLTAAELHLEFEKEQEAVVNRLTRELDMLRHAQNTSVASNTSSAAASATSSELPGVAESTRHHALLSGSGFSIPSAEGRRHDRSSSINSTRSLVGSTPGLTTGSASVVDITAPAPTRPTAVSLSRQNSIQSHLSRHSRTGSPLPSGSLSQSYSHLHLGGETAPSHGPGYFQRGAQPQFMPPATPGSQAELSPGLMPATSRYEETAYYRSQLDTVTRENDTLKRRIRELERMVRDRRASDASRPRSESVSTTASISVAAAPSATGAGIAGPRADGRERVVSVLSHAGSVAVGVPEEEVKFGESAFTAAARREGAAGSNGTDRGGQNTSTTSTGASRPDRQSMS